MLIAEYNMINYNEYLSSTLNKHLMNFYRLTFKRESFTEYNQNVNPCIFQSVGVAALRFGHSQIPTNYKVDRQDSYHTYTFPLRYKYFEMLEIWDGQVRPFTFWTHIQFYSFIFLKEPSNFRGVVSNAFECSGPTYQR